MPLSLEGVPVVPFESSMILSFITVLLVLTVVAVPVIVRSPVTVTLPLTVRLVSVPTLVMLLKVDAVINSLFAMLFLTSNLLLSLRPVSYTHLTLPTTPYE